MSRRLFATLVMILAACAAVTTCSFAIVSQTHVTEIDEDVTIVTADALPDHVMVVAHNQVRVQHIVRPKPPVAPAPGKPAPVESAALPAPCSDIKYYNGHYSRSQLDAMRVAAGLPKPSAAQLRAIDACLHS